MKNPFLPLLLSLMCLLVSAASCAQGTPDTVFTLDQQQIFVPPDFIERWETAFDDRIGQPSAVFQAKDFEGRVHSSEMYLGRVLILYFWSIWDWDACEKQTAELNRLTAKYTDLAIVSFVRETIDLAEFAFLQQHPAKFTIIPDSYDFGWQYHEHRRGTPVLFFMDKNGICRMVGNHAEDFEPWVIELLNQK